MRAAAGLLLVLLMLAAPGLARSEAVPGGSGDASPRRVIQLSDGWTFRFGVAGDEPAKPGFDDREWERVSLPHSWNRIGEHRMSRTAATDDRQGIGWYRRRFDAEPAVAGVRRYLDFGAVGAVADVWVNGRHVGRHEGAFSRFRFDVTNAWRSGAANVVAVRADNSRPAAGAATEHVLPLSADFFVHGGLYRGAALILAGDVGVDLLDHGGPGVYVRGVHASKASAEIRVLSRLRNAGAKTRRIDLAITIQDAAGREAAREVSAVDLDPGERQTESALTLAAPRLWNGRRDPYLYSARLDVLENGRLLDSVTQPFGLRSVRFDADHGFFLNGQRLMLRGASRHQDRPGKGWALSPDDHSEDMAFFVEIGANTVRQAHYQHADEWSDAADRAGMVVWAELPYVNMAALQGGAGSRALWDNAERQLRELIRQNYNHPSIVMWSIGNEVDSVADAASGAEPRRSLPLLKRLDEVAKQEDPFRPTIFADCCESRPGGETLAGAADLIGYNRYHGWYYSDPLKAGAELGAELDRLHRSHPTLPIAVAEYGAGGAISQHGDDVDLAYPSFAGRPQPEEFESVIHERSWPAIRDRPFVFGAWIWTMFDFATMREEGDSVGLNTKGLVTADRRTRKDVFHYYRAQWTSEPMIHLTAKRHVERAYPRIAVKAYSNAERATLTVNGERIGEAVCADRVCRWPDVPLSKGPNAAVVTARVGDVEVRDQTTWIGPDPDQGLRIDAGDMVSRRVGGRLFGSDSYAQGGVARAPDGGAAPTARVTGTDRPELYERWREGYSFAYDIPMPDGCWVVNLHTFEPPDGAMGSVAISVDAGGGQALAPFGAARPTPEGPLKGVERSFPVNVSGGRLKLAFSGRGGPAAVAAIEVDRPCR